MSLTNDLMMAYHMGYDDALARRMPDATKAKMLNSSNCTDSERTSDELRDDLQRANAENARLRSELESVGTAAYLYGRSDLKAENTKLRELGVEVDG